VRTGGDQATGKGTVSDAIASGINAALELDSSLSMVVNPMISEAKGRIVGIDAINFDRFSRSKRLKSRSLKRNIRLKGFREVNRSIPFEGILREAGRCFLCGKCNNCGVCEEVCPDIAIDREVDGLSVDYEYCKGCGICATECPRGIFVLEREELWKRL